MKNLTLILVLCLGSTYAYSGSKEITSCHELNSNSNDQYYINNNKESEPVNFCEENIYHVGKSRMSKSERKEMKKREESLRKECKKKAKAYKRAVAKSLFKKLKLKQGLQALFKSKKKLMKTKLTKGKSKRHREEVLSSLSQSELAGLRSGEISKEEFSQLVMENIRKEIPNIDEMVKESQQKNKFTKGFDQKEVFPVNIVIRGERGKSCVLKMDDFPEEEEFKPEPCALCKPEVIQNNFSNDCSYMVNANFSEKEARELVGADAVKDKSLQRDSHCNHDMNGVSNDMSQINRTVTKLCRLAKEGLAPDFTIETTRNEYNDKTDNLALKRGEFTQKYIYAELRRKNGPCEFSANEEIPDWLQDEEEFKKHVTISSPKYQRPNAVVGDYGPKPNARGSEAEKEKLYLAQTLSAEIKGLNEKIQDYTSRIKDIETELVQMESEIADEKKNFATRKASNIKGSLIEGMNNKTLELTNISRNAQAIYSNKKRLNQEKSDLKIKIEGLEGEIKSNKYSKNPSGEYQLVKKLDDFYKGDRTNREKWDKELFNQFKMARITGDISKKNEYDFDQDMVTPELSLMLKTLVEVDNFTCELKPLETSRVSLEGVLKAPLKIVTAATLPAAGVIAGVGGAFNWMCRGCLTPGNQPPKISFKFKQNMPHAWRDVKDAASSYVNWGGALEVNKRKYKTRHHLEDYSSPLYGQTSTSQESCVDSDGIKEKSNSHGRKKGKGSSVIMN